jgi:hypothetical protein
MCSSWRGAALFTVGIAVALFGSVAMPADAAAPPSTATALGTFGTAASSITFQDAPRGNCLLTVTGIITFPGPMQPDPNPVIVGTAAGVTTAVVGASCADAQANPPGTFPDVFRSKGTFVGTIGGVSITGTLTYQGVTQAGGHIDADITIRDGRVSADLSADARVLQGGSYTGTIRT